MLLGMADVYRSAAGRAAVRRWCDARLDEWTTPARRTVVDRRLGPTHLLTAGAGEVTVVYLPGTNANAATSTSLVAVLARRHPVVVADVPGQPGLSADPSGVYGLVLLDPAGLLRLRVNPAVLRSTAAGLFRPTPARSARLLQHLHARSRQPSADEVEWMTLVARHTRTSLAPFPVPAEVSAPWRAVPRRVLRGEQDTFLPVGRLRAAVRERLDVELQVLDGAGHLTTEEQPSAVVGAVAQVAGGARA